MKVEFRNVLLGVALSTAILAASGARAGMFFSSYNYSLNVDTWGEDFSGSQTHSAYNSAPDTITARTSFGQVRALGVATLSIFGDGYSDRSASFGLQVGTIVRDVISEHASASASAQVSGQFQVDFSQRYIAGGVLSIFDQTLGVFILSLDGGIADIILTAGHTYFLNAGIGLEIDQWHTTQTLQMNQKNASFWLHATPVPEPESLVGLLVAGLLVLGRKRGI